MIKRPTLENIRIHNAINLTNILIKEWEYIPKICYEIMCRMAETIQTFHFFLIDFFLNEDNCYIYLVFVYLLVCEEVCAYMGVVIRG